MKWARGAETVSRLIAEGRLERIAGTAATGSMHLDSARGLLASAQREVSNNPEASYILAYDAVRPIDNDRLDVELALVACRWLGRTMLTPADPA